MKSKTMQPRELPTVEQLTAELGREKYKRRYKRVLRSTIYTLIVVAAVAVLVATIWMPVLQIYGASMAPTLDEGDIVISVKGSDFAPGDLVAFYMGNKILVKRCIAGPGQWVDIDADGNVYKAKVHMGSCLIQMHHGRNDILFSEAVLKEAVGIIEIFPLLLNGFSFQPVRCAAHKAVLHDHAVLPAFCSDSLDPVQDRLAVF